MCLRVHLCVFDALLQAESEWVNVRKHLWVWCDLHVCMHVMCMWLHLWVCLLFQCVCMYVYGMNRMAFPPKHIHTAAESQECWPPADWSDRFC